MCITRTFSHAFARKIAAPGTRAIDAGGQPLSSIARFGFYTFNIDIYIDTDRKSGSGLTAMLPGRVAQIAPENAWEKVVSLSPKPYEATSMMKQLLKDQQMRAAEEEQESLDPEAQDQIAAAVSRDMDARYFFPTRIRVTGSKVQFFVPSSFLGGSAKKDWGYVIALSGAELNEKMNLASTVGMETKGDPSLMIMPIAEGTSTDRFGTKRKGTSLLPPLVDIIVPKGMKQEEILRSFDAKQKTPVRLPAVVPASN